MTSINKNSEFCVNCARSLSQTEDTVKYVTHPIFHPPHYDHTVNNENEESTIGSILTSIYKLQLQEGDENELNLNCAVCCVQCAGILSRLYEFYVEFDRLRHLESVLSKLLAKSIAVTFPDCPRTVEEGDEDEEPGEDQEAEVWSSGGEDILTGGSPVKNWNHFEDDASPQSSSSASHKFEVDVSSIIPNKRSRVETKTENSVPLPTTPSSQPDLRLNPCVKLKRLTLEDLRKAGIFLVFGDGAAASTTTTNFQGNLSRSSRMNRATRHRHAPVSQSQSMQVTKEGSHDDEDSLFDPDDEVHQGSEEEDEDIEPNLDDEDCRDNDKSGVIPKAKKKKKSKFSEVGVMDAKFSDLGTVSYSSKKTRVPCAHCSKTFPKHRVLREHMSTCHPDQITEIYRCPLCFKLLKSNGILKKHMQLIHYTAKAFPCSQCDLSFPVRDYLTRHMVVHSETKNHLCPHCGRGFKQARTLGVHLLLHTGEKPHECNICHKRFRHFGGINKHKRAHQISLTESGERIHSRDARPSTKKLEDECPCCSLKFPVYKDWKEHMATQHPDQVQLFRCPVCSKLVRSETYLKTHLKLHDPAKPFSCLECGRSFGNQIYLNTHIRGVHSAEATVKDHLCPQCGRRFKHQRSLTLHLLTHAEDKSFQCKTCGKFFGHPSGLRSHEETHKDRPLHFCSICGTGFTRKQNLLRHEILHGGDRPFKCEFPGCSQTYRDVSSLRKHRRVHDPNDTVKRRRPRLQTQEAVDV